MARSIEAQGVTVEEAIQVALNRLGVSRSQVEIAILGHPRKGLFGIGAKRAKVRATLRETSFSDGEEFEISAGGRRRRNRRGRRSGRRRGGGEQTAEQEGPREGQPRQQGRRQERDKSSGGSRRGRGQQGRGRGQQGHGRGQQGRDRRQEDREAREPRPQGRDEGERSGPGPQRAQQSASKSSDAESSAAPERQASEAAAAEPATSSSQDAGQPVSQEATATVAERPGGIEAASVEASPAAANASTPKSGARAEEAGAGRSKETLTLEQARERTLEVVREMMRLMGFEETTVEPGDWDGPEEICVQVRCEAEGLLIGRHGQTLDAVEHIVNRMVLAGENRDWRIALDVGGYRERRRDILLELADRLKVRAMTQGRRVQVSPMSPRDRRVFQGALARDDSVFTRVVGSGFYRRVMIVPVGLEDDDSPVEEVQHEAPRHSAIAGEVEDEG